LTQIIFLAVQINVDDKKDLLSGETLMRLLDFFTTALSIIIVAVPEGLPLAVSISLAYSIDTMKKDNLLVKNMEACETMGTVNNICTGKTATLTKNDMTVSAIYTARQSLPVDQKFNFKKTTIPQTVVDILRDCIIYNCESRVEMNEDAKYVAVGNGTEVGLLRFLQANKFEIQDLLSKRHRKSIVQTNIPFGPERKRSLIALKPTEKSDFVRVVIKGAPEYVIPMCSTQLSESGSETQLDANEKKRVLDQEIIGQFCKRQGLRSIVYAYKDIDIFDWDFMKKNNNNFEKDKDREYLERDFCFVAGFGL
jgi:magnesium-transporting ATPase (P-type)